MIDFNKIYGQDPDAEKKRILREMKTQSRILIQENRFDEALSIAAELCETDPHDADVWHIRAIASNGAGQLQDAERYCRKALAIKPANVGAAFTLAGTLYKQGNVNAAITVYLDALIHYPDHVEVLNNLGSLLRQVGRLDEAAYHLERARSLRPREPFILNNLGLLNRELGKLPDAIRYFQESLIARPDYTEAHHNLANTLLQQGNYQDAESHYRKAIELNPHFVLAYHGLASLLTNQGKFDAAQSVLGEALVMDPKNSELAATLSDIHLKQGKSNDALRILEPLLSGGVISPLVARSFARIAPCFGRQQEAIEILNRQLESHELPLMMKREMYFTRGNLYDTAGEYERAFSDIERAHRLVDTQAGVQAGLQQVNHVIQNYPSSTENAPPKASAASNLPVFIVGMPGSGADLIEKILSGHSKIASAGISSCMGEILNSLSSRCGAGSSYPSCIDMLDEPALNEISSEYQQKLSTSHASAKKVLDCTLHNFLHLGFINRLFPDSRVIHCIRNPIDTCLANWFTNYPPNTPYAGSLEDLAGYYKSYLQIVAQWKTSLDIPILDITYEDMAARGEPLIGELLDFCGVDQEQTCLDVFASEKNSACFTDIRLHNQAYRDSVDYWKHYEDFIGPLIQALG